MPDAAFTTDVMVGFPGETDEQFANTVAFVREIGFMHLHVFRFSPRPGTVAATLRPTVPAEVAEARAAQLIAVGKELWAQFARQFVGTERTVLVETCRPIGDSLLPDGLELSGLTDNYLRVRWTSDRPVPIGTLVSVRLVGVHEQGFVVGEAG
jgi:threonylcarbamoyladenosine tRNA methylthiotransferase MtaB